MSDREETVTVQLSTPLELNRSPRGEESSNILTEGQESWL